MPGTWWQSPDRQAMISSKCANDFAQVQCRHAQSAILQADLGYSPFYPVPCNWSSPPVTTTSSLLRVGWATMLQQADLSLLKQPDGTSNWKTCQLVQYEESNLVIRQRLPNRCPVDTTRKFQEAELLLFLPKQHDVRVLWILVIHRQNHRCHHRWTIFLHLVHQL